MAVVVVLLRGINVGGRGKLPMAQLREIATAAGIEDVRTYIQSGNLVGVAPRGSTSALATRLREHIATATSLDPEVSVRTLAELAKVVAANPFVARGEDPAHLHVTFLSHPTARVLTGHDPAAWVPEEVVAIDRELHLLLPDGMGRSKLAASLARRAAGGTTRNWRTVTTLLEMAGELA
jgi:uncharacterized protein (DUF1697 family)